MSLNQQTTISRAHYTCCTHVPTCSRWRNRFESLPVHTPDVRSKFSAAISLLRESPRARDRFSPGETRSRLQRGERREGGKNKIIYRKRFENFYVRFAARSTSNWRRYRSETHNVHCRCDLALQRVWVEIEGISTHREENEEGSSNICSSNFVDT